MGILEILDVSTKQMKRQYKRCWERIPRGSFEEVSEMTTWLSACDSYLLNSPYVWTKEIQFQDGNLFSINIIKGCFVVWWKYKRNTVSIMHTEKHGSGCFVIMGLFVFQVKWGFPSRWMKIFFSNIKISQGMLPTRQRNKFVKEK